MMVGNKIVAVYIDKADIGISSFTTGQARIQCSALTSFCFFDYPQIRSIFNAASFILTNNSTHDIFDFHRTQKSITQISEKGLQLAQIQESLNLLPTEKQYQSNHKNNFIAKMISKQTHFISLGILIFYLQNETAYLIENKIYLEDIDYFIDTQLQIVQVGKEELEFLEISREEIHPSLIKGKGNSKEGYSVLSAFLSYLITPTSKRVLRTIFLNPTFNKSILQERQEIIGWMKQKMRQAPKIIKIFKWIHPIESILKKFDKIVAQEEDWKKMLKTLESLIELKKHLTHENAPALVKEFVTDECWKDIFETVHLIKENIETSPLRVKSNVDEELDCLRQTFDNMPHLLTLHAKEQNWDLDFRIIFISQVGYLIKLVDGADVPTHNEDDEWVLQFTNDAAHFYSNKLTQFLDEHYGDVHGELEDRERKILIDLAIIVSEKQSSILNIFWRAAVIECFWGVSQIGKSMCKPKLSSEALLIVNGWHLLLAENAIGNHSFSFGHKKAPHNQVYNSQQNLVNTNYSNRCSILSGPNGSGKTIYMKQVGVMIYLTHLGFYLPAHLAQIPLTDQIIFIGKEESIFNAQISGLYSELASLSRVTTPFILSSKAFVMIDELCSEINYENSLKLLYATIKHLSNPQTKFIKNRLLAVFDNEFFQPLCLIITHLTQIVSSSVVVENYEIRLLTMQVEKEGLSLFKIKPGIVKNGYGIRMASTMMGGEFIEKAKYYSEIVMRN